MSNIGPGAPHLSRWFQHTAVITRRSLSLYSATAIADASGLSISRDPAVYCDCEISGFTTGSGTVILTGTDEADVAASYTFTFSANGRKLNGTQRFKTITRVQTTGLADEATVGTVLIRATSKTGQPSEQWVSAGSITGRLSRPRLGEVVKATGETALESSIFYFYPTEDLRNNDKVSFEGTIWEVKAVIKFHGRRGEHYLNKAVLFAEDTTT